MRANIVTDGRLLEKQLRRRDMEVTTLGLFYKDPPVTKQELIQAQQAVQPVNFPSYKAEISDKAKALAAAMAEAASKSAKSHAAVHEDK